MWTNEWINKSEAIDFFPPCFYGLLHVNGQSNFHWAEFLGFFFFFNLFHLKKIEFTSEMLTHARLCKVLACVALKKRRTFSALFLLLFLYLGFFLWMVRKTAQQSLRRSWSCCVPFAFCTSVCPILLVRLWGLLILRFLEGLGGQGEEQRMSGHAICYLDCTRRIQVKTWLSQLDCGHSQILIYVPFSSENT